MLPLNMDSVTQFLRDDAKPSAEAPAFKPIAWVRQHPDGTLTDELLPDSRIENARKRSGAWVPLGRIGSVSASQVPRAWTRAEAIQAAHAAGFAGESWVMGPEELAVLLTRASGVLGRGDGAERCVEAFIERRRSERNAGVAAVASTIPIDPRATAAADEQERTSG